MRRRGGFFRFILVVLLLSGGVFAAFKIFSVNAVHIYGLENKTYDAVRAASGIQAGESLFTLDTQAAEDRLRQDPYLDVQEVRVKFPNEVEILLRERRMRAFMEYYRGTTVLMDEEGMVLDALNTVPGDLDVPMVTGLAAGAVEVGKIIEIADPMQLIAMQTLLDVLDAQNALGFVVSINVANLDSLTLETHSRIVVQLGDRENMETKIQWMTAMLAQLEREKKTGGVLNVATAKYADYQPAAGTTPTDVLDDMPEDAGDDGAPDGE